MSAIKIQEAHRGDAAVLSALGTLTFVEKFGHLYRHEDLQRFLAEKQSEDWYTEFISDPKTLLLIAWEGKDAVGFVAAGPLGFNVPVPANNPGEIARLYVRGSHQSLGIGARLMDDALAWLDQRHDDLFLSVYSENEGAQRFYHRYGFAKIGQHHFMVGEHADLDFIYAQKG